MPSSQGSYVSSNLIMNIIGGTTYSLRRLGVKRPSGYSNSSLLLSQMGFRRYFTELLSNRTAAKSTRLSSGGAPTAGGALTELTNSESSDVSGHGGRVSNKNDGKVIKVSNGSSNNFEGKCIKKNA